MERRTLHIAMGDVLDAMTTSADDPVQMVLS